MTKANITCDVVRKHLHYDPNTGVFTRLVRTAQSIQVGDVAGSLHNCGYTAFYLLGNNLLAHRVAWLYVTGDWPKYAIDHINGQRTDNRFVNLRDVPIRVNNENQRRAAVTNKSCGLLGATWHKATGTWMARIQSKGQNHYLGYFATAQEAHASYVEAKRRLHEGCTI